MLGLLIWLIALGQSPGSTAECSWLETSQQDFRDGTFERNIYASHRQGGAVEFTCRFDLNNDGYVDLAMSHCFSTSYVYWGSASGYDPVNRTAYGASRGGNCDAADLNVDGFPDLLWINYPYLTIYWGTSSGPDPFNYFRFGLYYGSNEAMAIADFNKDGHLDIVAEAYTGSTAAVFWGSSTGYSEGRRTELPNVGGDHNAEVGDFDRNGWLDLLLLSINGSNTIYWGRNTGFSSADRTLLPYYASLSHGSSVADLNRDGYLDLVLSTYAGSSVAHIYWGNPSGYSTGNRTVLSPGSCFGGSSVADMNGDGFLDILFFTGYGPVTMPWIYWGSANGYSDSNRSQVGPTLDCSGAFLADLDADGDLDMFLNRWNGTSSYIAWGPSFTSWLALPSDHGGHGMYREGGNVYSREYCDDYLSSVFDAASAVDWGRITWLDSLPAGTGITMAVRSGRTPIPDTSWSTWVTVTNNSEIPAQLNARFLQYRARFGYANLTRFPLLYEVKVQYGSTTNARIDIDPNVINLKSVGKPITAYIELAGLPVDSIDINTVKLEYQGRAVSANRVPCGVGDYNGNGVPDFMAKFDRQRVISILQPGLAILTVSGNLRDGTGFAGQDTVEVINPSDELLDIDISPCPVLSKSNKRLAFSLGNADPNDIVSLKIFDVAGRCVRTLMSSKQDPRARTLVWDGRSDAGALLPNGVYRVNLQTSTRSVTKKLLVLR